MVAELDLVDRDNGNGNNRMGAAERMNDKNNDGRVDSEEFAEATASDLSPDTEIEKADIPKEAKEGYEGRYGLSGWKKAKIWGRKLWRGENTEGRIVGAVLDIGELFAPRWAGSLRSKLQSNDRPMLQKILSLKNFINLKDEDGNFDPKELLYSVIQIAIAFGVVYGAVELGIWDQLISILGDQNG